MSMLAGPRRKQKVVNLRATNSAWSNDTNKFGQRMLEKMGWSSGKGLGAKENGIVEHVIAKYKNDDKGLGYEDKNDQWTKHEDDFNALLTNLSNGDKKEVVLHSGVSLEKKSKTSKARIHYHKFTRGKDLSRYSAKDLANIFGKKSLTDKEKTEVEQDEVTKEDEKKTEQVFTEKGSMEDYFKMKLAAFKMKSTYPENNDHIQNTDCGFQGFSSIVEEDNEEDDHHQDLGFKSFSLDIDVVNEKIENNLSKEPEKKKKKKSKKQCTELNSDITSDQTEHKATDEVVLDEDQKKEKVKKKSKKNKQLRPLILNTDVEEEPLKKKKSKKNKTKICDIQDYVDVDEHVPKKKKKKKDL